MATLNGNRLETDLNGVIRNKTVWTGQTMTVKEYLPPVFAGLGGKDLEVLSKNIANTIF